MRRMHLRYRGFNFVMMPLLIDTTRFHSYNMGRIVRKEVYSVVARIDFNCDMGESFGIHKLGFDEKVIKYITSANIACGFHSGDPSWMRRTVELAGDNSVAIGAHTSFPDLIGFGRRNMAVSHDEVRDYVVYQIGALAGFVKSNKLQHVKPHGAMYNMAVSDESIARAICQAVLDVDANLILVVLFGSKWHKIACEMGLRVAREVFADRAVNLDGSLVDRSKEGAVISDPDEVVQRSLQMVLDGSVTSISGERIPIEVDTLCMHGDTPGAVEIAKNIKATFEEHRVQVIPMGSFI